MKHFWVFAFVSIIITAFFGGFAFPEKGFAQSIDSQTATGNILNTNQVTQADFESLKATGDDIEFNAKAVPPEGFSTSYLDFYGQKIVGAATMLSPAGLLSGLSGQTINGVDGTYFKNAYIKILTDTYNEKKDVPGTTKNYLEQTTLIRYKGFLEDILFSQKIQNTTILSSIRTATRQELGQAYVVLKYTEVKLSIASTKVQADRGKITDAEKTSLINASTGSMSAALVGAAQAMNTTKPAANCDLWDWTITGCIDSAFTWIIKNVLLELVGFFLWMSANLLNFAMYHGIFRFKDFAPNEIYSIWLVVRQVVSLFVFFAALFVGFMSIIGKSEDFKKYVAFLVVFGLFVNFSYPVVRIFVDVSNVVSLQIYQSTMGGEILSDNPSDSSTAGARIMTSLGLQGLVVSATSVADNKNNQFLDQIRSTPGALAAVGFVGYAAYIFFMAAFLIIVRTALLVCIIIASPILLVDTVVPALGKSAGWLRGMFVSQLFVAPVFTIMLALTLKFLDVFSKTAGNTLNGAGDTLNAAAAASSVTVFFNLIMMLVMLHIMLKVTKAVAGGVGETVTNWAGKAGGLGVGLTAGTAMAGLGFAGRRTLGVVGERLGQQGGIIGDVGRKMASAKYDLRNLKMVQSGANKLGVTSLGEGVNKNRKEILAERHDEYVKTANTLDNDEARGQYLARKFDTGTFAKLAGTASQNSKAYTKYIAGDEDTIKQYINANEEGRKKMMEDEKNKKYLQRFSNIDSGNQSKMSAETQKAYAAKKARDEAQQTRNESRVVNYLTSDQATRESLIANAKASDDKELQKQLAAMEILSRETAGQINEAKIITAGITDPNLIAKILAKDTEMKNSAVAQANQATANATQQTNATNLYNAQLAAAQAVQNAQAAATITAQQTAQALNKMVQGNDAILDLLGKVMKNGGIQNNGKKSSGQAKAGASAIPVSAI